MLMNPLYNCLALRQATRRMTQLCDQALAPLDLRAIQLSMLREIDWLGPIALNPLAEAMAMDRATPGHNIRSLEMFGLVHLATGADLRSRQVMLTPKGHVPLARAWKLWRKAQKV
jgi:DNA-binding MarR family transcriptional regulator